MHRAKLLLIATLIAETRVGAEPVPIVSAPVPVAGAATGATPHLESATEALAQDAAEYARLYGLLPARAMLEVQAMAASLTQTDALQEEFAGRLAGLFLEHEGGLKVVLLLTGDTPEAARTIEAAGMTIPVLFRVGAPATRSAILAAIDAHQADLRAALSSPPGMGVNPRTGMLAVMIRADEVDAEGQVAMAERLSAIAGVPVEVKRWGEADLDTRAHAEEDPNKATAALGGSGTNASTPVPLDGRAPVGGGRVIGYDPEIAHKALCTSGFVVTDGAHTGLATAAHCPDALSYVAPGGAANGAGGAVPLTMVGAWGARYQDVQIHVATDAAATPFLPIFFADTAKTLLRSVATWRNRASLRAGDMVCHRGERTGYSCAEVEYPDYAPPGDLCAGSCTPTWVAVAGPICKGGDSGGPVFLGEAAIGLVKGSSYAGDGRCRLYYFMSVDYLPESWRIAISS